MLHTVLPNNSNNGYPMYFLTKKAEHGVLINAAHNNEIQVGDGFQLSYRGIEYKVVEII